MRPILENGLPRRAQSPRQPREYPGRRSTSARSLIATARSMPANCRWIFRPCAQASPIAAGSGERYRQRYRRGRHRLAGRSACHPSPQYPWLCATQNGESPLSVGRHRPYRQYSGSRPHPPRAPHRIHSRDNDRGRQSSHAPCLNQTCCPPRPRRSGESHHLLCARQPYRPPERRGAQSHRHCGAWHC